ncbi:MAG: phosphoribosylformylglycinamidine cyclo-ligase [Gammaproteobacteria bacterium]
MSKKRNTTDAYAKAGVDIDAGNLLVKKITPSVKQTHHRNVIKNFGGFAGLYKLPKNYQSPILVACTDGVGTKVALSKEYSRLQDIGQDLVAMCVNDMITMGAKPLYFLDYFATSKLKVEEAALVIKSIATACQKVGCALLGGETAEMPGHYKSGQFDLAGFATGIVEHDQIIDGKSIKSGDSIIAISSSGPHSNGYSLIRKILKKHTPPKQILRSLLAPTILYPEILEKIIEKRLVAGMANITGGGLIENIPRAYGTKLKASIELDSWKIPDCFQWLKKNGSLSSKDMLKTFNCGVGMVLFTDKDYEKRVLKLLRNKGVNAFRIGSMEKRREKEPAIIFNNQLV